VKVQMEDFTNDTPTVASKIDLGEFETPPQKSGATSLFIGGGLGCVLLLCLGLMASGAFFLVRNAGSDEVEAAGAEVETVTPQDNELPVGKEADTETEAMQTETEVEVSEAEVSEVVPQEGQPEMGQLNFSLDPQGAGTPAESLFSFETGVSQIHVIFEYANLSPEKTWTQVWFHNGNEVFSTSQPWLEAESGVFDYIIEAGGEPLPAGQWALEFHIDGELLTAGSFVIEDPAATDSAVQPTPVEPIRVYKLVYTRWNGEKHDLYVGDTNGSSEQFVLGRAAGPSWSPDGRYIYFYGEEGVDNQVIGGKLIPLPDATNGIIRIEAAPLPASVGQAKLFQGHGWNDGNARWANVSPDGSMIAYDGDRGGGRRVYFLGTAGNQQFRYEIIGEQADWSPDSQKIVYRSGRNNQVGLWISNRTDSGHFRLTSGGTDSFPAWSPDGQMVAFSRDGGGNVDIYTVKIDGTDLKRLTETPGHDTLPLYLPNGDLVFRSARNGRWGIWKMKGDGSSPVEIIPNAPVGPEWSFSRMDVLR
jgi:hypothetical protein